MSTVSVNRSRPWGLIRRAPRIGVFMERISVRLFAAAACIGASMPFAAPGVDEAASPIFGVKIPPGYRDWGVISVAHEAGNNNDLRAVLGNDVAVKAYREGKLPFPDGAIIARLAWSYV